MEAESDSCLPSFLTTYKTSKVVVLKSPYLQVPNVCLQVLIAFYILFYSLAYNLRFMDSEEANGDPDVTVIKPMSNWATCSNSDFDCNLDLGSPKDLAYCSNRTPFGVVFKHGVKHQRRVERCWQSDLHIAPSGSILVPTMISFLYQTWNATQGDWMTDEVKEYYMQNIESFLLRFRHSFVTSSGLKKASMDMDGDFNTEVGRYQFAAGAILKEYQKKHEIPDPWSSIADLETCGTDPNTASDQSTVCSRTVWGNMISVKQLLNLSSILSLDDARQGMDGATYRQSGLGIAAHITYHNDDNVWTRFFFHGLSLSSLLSPPPFYTLDIKREPLARDFVIESEVTHPSKDSKIDLDRRLVQQRTGIQIRISASGKIHFASARQLLLSAVSAIALLSLAQLLVENGLVKIYRKIASLQHITAMYNYHKMKGSKTEKQFQQQLEQLRTNGDEDAYKHLIEDEVVSMETAQALSR